MLRRVVSYLSLFAVLLHLHWGCCVHLAACQRTGGEQIAIAPSCCHGHRHTGEHAPAETPPAAPQHDDCHESHADAVLSAPLVAPDHDGAPAWFAADGSLASIQVAHPLDRAAFGDGEASALVPLRAAARSPILLN
jgi:hypothetical protein